MLGFFQMSPLGNVIGLNRFTLKFAGHGEEDGYLHHCNRRLCAVWPMFMLAMTMLTTSYIAGSVYNFGLPWQQSSDRLPVELTLFLFRVAIVVQAGSQVAIFKSSKLSRSFGYLKMEISIIILGMFALISTFGRYYFAKMMGHADPYEIFTRSELPSTYTDNLFSLQLFLVVALTHVCPIRWCSLLFLEIAAPLVYAIPIIFAWTPEDRKITCFLLFLLLTALLGYGKRSTEVNDRLVFSSYLAEKTMRLEAEFALAQRAETRKDDEATVENASIPETATTGEIFNALDAEANLPYSLNAILNIGRNEQWIVDQDELTVDPESCLGVGGFGIVLAGEFNGSPAALKVMKDSGKGRSLFDVGNELRLLRKLRHSNIVLFHGACVDLAHNDIVLVMERVFGTPMNVFVNSSPSTHDRLQALLGACQGLMYLHTRKPFIVHGDLKPGNIMVEQRGSQVHAKILDFGLARVVTSKAVSGGGTLRWMAPEMLKGSQRPSVASDVYAFGLIIYYTVTGKIPFEEMSLKSLKVNAKSTLDSESALFSPVGSSEILTTCMPVVRLATKRLPQERGAMGDIHRMLREIDSGQPALRCASDLWGSLLIVRQAINAKNKSQFTFLRWFEKVKFVEDLVNPPQNSLKPVQEESNQDSTGVPSSTETGVVSYPGFAVTPPCFMKVSIIETLLSWNCMWPPDACCEYHSLLNSLGELHHEMKAYPCKRVKKHGSLFEQCPVCSLVAPKDEDVAEVTVCGVCGFEGLFRQCQQSKRHSGDRDTPPTSNSHGLSQSIQDIDDESAGPPLSNYPLPIAL